MENLLVWILIFAGATIGLLATFLIASERQLQKAEEEEAPNENIEKARQPPVAAYATPRGEEFQSPENHQELAGEIARLNTELNSSRATVSELQQWLIHSQRRQENLSERAERLEAELESLKRQPQPVRETKDDFTAADQSVAVENRQLEQEIAHLNRVSEEHEALTREAARLQQQLANEAVKINELETARQELTDANREVSDDNLRLRAQIDALRQQLADADSAQERWQQAQRLMSTIVAKQAAAADNAQEIQHALLRLSELVVASDVAQQPENAPETAQAAAQESDNDAVELTEREVFFTPKPDDLESQPLRRGGDSRAELASSLLAITVFLGAIGVLASQTSNLLPEEPGARETATTAPKSLSNNNASPIDGAPGQHEKTTQVAGVDSDTGVVAKTEAESPH